MIQNILQKNWAIEIVYSFAFSELVEECWEEIKEPSYFDLIYTFYPSGKTVKKCKHIPKTVCRPTEGNRCEQVPR